MCSNHNLMVVLGACLCWLAHLTNLTAFYEIKMNLIDHHSSRWMKRQQWVFSTSTSGNAFNSFTTPKLRKGGSDEQTMRWIESWPNSRFQRVIMSDTGSSWRLVPSGASQVSYGAQHCLAYPAITWMKG